MNKRRISVLADLDVAERLMHDSDFVRAKMYAGVALLNARSEVVKNDEEWGTVLARAEALHDMIPSS